MAAAPQPSSGVPGRFGALQARVWSADRASAAPRLVVVLHGDLAGETDAYQYRFAEAARRTLRDTVVMAILRPGYADDEGARSPGAHGLATGDNYTPEAISALRDAILAAREKFHAQRVTLVGHSGGAALAADLAGEDPPLVSRLLLVSCPCDLRAWRAHMAERQMNPLWLLPTRSRSPADEVSKMSADLRVRLAVGQDDVVTPPELTTAFVKAADARGLRVSAVIMPGVGHTALLDPRVLQELVALEAAQ